MNELLGRILKYLPQYLSDFLSLLAKPKAFLTARATGRQVALTNAMLFLIISFVLCFMLCATITPLKDVFADSIRLGVVLFLMLILLLLALNLSWKCVGGGARPDQNSVIYAYQAGPILLLFALRHLVIFGLLRPMDPSAWEELLQAGPSQAASGIPMQAVGSSDAATLALIVAIATTVLTFLWSVGTWGAYRVANQTSRIRSIGAFLISTVLVVPVNFLCTALGAALAGG